MKNKSTVSSEEKVELRRVQLDLPPKAYERLTALKVETEASTYVEVIRNALRLYAEVIDLQKSGNKFLLETKDGCITPLLIFKT